MAAIVSMAAIGVWAVSTQQMSYVITSGISMQPVYHENDLVIVMRSDSYEVGQIAAYHSHAGVKALHRIIGGDGERGYVLKGDNNQSIDVDKPTADKLIGRAVLHIPQGGNWLQPVLNPTGLGMLGFLIVGGGAAAPKTRREMRRRRRQKRATGMSSWVTAVTMVKAISRLHPALRALAVATALLGLLGITLGVLGWMKPITQTQVNTPGNHESLAFSYSANVGKTPAYDSTTVTAPDPIFRKVAPSVDLKLDYRGRPGRITVRARIVAGNGWQSVMQLAAQKRFTSSIYRTTMPLDLAAIDDRAKAAAEAIGAAAGELTVTVRVHVQHDDGTEFTPELPLKVNDLQLFLAQGPGSLVADATQATAGARVQPRQISAFGHDLLSAADARRYAVFMVLAALASIVFVALSALRRTPLQSRSQIQRRYPHLLVPVEPMASPPGKPVVIVDTFPALVKLAEKYGQMILTWTRPDGADDFVVRDEGILYRYRIDPNATAAKASPEIPAPDAARTDRSRTSESTLDTAPVMGLPPVPVSPPETGAEPAEATVAGVVDDSTAGDEAVTAGTTPAKTTAPRKRAAKTATSKTAAAKAAAKTAGTRAPAKRTRAAAKPPPPPVPTTEASLSPAAPAAESHSEPAVTSTESHSEPAVAGTGIKPDRPVAEADQPTTERPAEALPAMDAQSKVSDTSDPQSPGIPVTDIATISTAAADDRQPPVSAAAGEKPMDTAGRTDHTDSAESSEPAVTAAEPAVTAASADTDAETGPRTEQTTSSEPEESPVEPEHGAPEPHADAKQEAAEPETPQTDAEQVVPEPDAAAVEVENQRSEPAPPMGEARPSSGTDVPEQPAVAAEARPEETAEANPSETEDRMTGQLETDAGQSDAETPASEINEQDSAAPVAELQAGAAPATAERPKSQQSRKSQKPSSRRKSRSRRTPHPTVDEPQATADEPRATAGEPQATNHEPRATAGPASPTGPAAGAREAMEDLAERNLPITTPEPGAEAKPVPEPDAALKQQPAPPVHNREPIYDFLPAAKRHHPAEPDDIDEPEA